MDRKFAVSVATDWWYFHIKNECERQAIEATDEQLYKLYNSLFEMLSAKERSAVQHLCNVVGQLGYSYDSVDRGVEDCMRDAGIELVIDYQVSMQFSPWWGDPDEMSVVIYDHRGLKKDELATARYLDKEIKEAHKASSAYYGWDCHSWYVCNREVFYGS